MNSIPTFDVIEYGDVFRIADTYSIPASVTIEVGTTCNLRCKHCYIPNHDNNTLRKDEIDDIFRQLRDMGTFEIVLTGGELFLRDDAIELVQLARNYGFDLVIFSNATLVTEEVARKLGACYVGRFSTSIYSMNDETHDGITGIKGSLQKTLTGLSFLRRFNVPVEVKTMLMRDNFNAIEDIQRYCDDNGFGFVVSPYIFCRTDLSREPIEMRLDTDTLKRVMPTIDSIVGFSPQKRHKDDFMCQSLQHSFGISASGKVYPCNALFFEVGDIRENRLCEIWHSEKLAKVKQIRWGDLPKCSRCNVSNYCVRCAGIALGETGSMVNDFDFACTIAKIRSKK